MAKTLVYHDNCQDGFCAAWLFHRLYPDAEFIPAQYGQPAPDVTGKDVVIADFSYPRETMIAMAAQANSLVCLDHHKTARADLEGVDWAALGATVVFDMSKSGAMLMWEYLWPVPEPALLVRYVQDRDLWLWQEMRSREVSAFIGSFPKDFSVWNRFESDIASGIAFTQGEAILRYQAAAVAEQCKHAEICRFGDYRFPVLNATLLISEIGEALGKTAPFAAMYFVRGDEKVWSLRSDGKVDVSAIAKEFGGGGHRGAAGFRTPASFQFEKATHAEPLFPTGVAEWKGT